MSSLIEGIPSRYGRNSMSDLNPELVIGLRGLKSATWFVDSVSGSASGNGMSWASAVTTVTAAVALAGAGDTILCAPGHTETIIAAGTVTVSKGCQVIGLGVGRNRATFNYTTSTAGTFLVTGANVRLSNLVFRPLGIDAVVAPVAISGADCEILGCDFEHANATNQATTCIVTSAAADRLTVAGCRFYGTADAGTAQAILLIGGDGHIIQDNVCSGAYTSSLGFINNSTTACTNVIVRRNSINNLTASSTKCMVFVSTSTGMISQNFMQILSGTAPITGAAMSWVGGNYYVGTIATLGTLI